MANITSARISVCINEDTSHPLEVITIVTSILGVMISILIIIHATILLPKQKEIHNTFKVLFYVSASFTGIIVATAAASTIFCMVRVQAWALSAGVLSLSTYFLLLCSLLTTLLIRLKHTFDGSVYEVVKTKQCFLLILYILFFISAATAVIFFIIVIYEAFHKETMVSSEQYDSLNRICISFASLAGIFYVSAAIYACYIFANTLMHIANLGATSMQNIVQNEESNDCQLNKTQTKLIDSITRYVNLFCLATIGSVMVIIVLAAGKYLQKYDKFVGQIYLCISTVDAVVNLLCLYLQYQFNAKYYNKYCQCVEGCWKRFFIKLAKQNMYRSRQDRICQLKPLKLNITEASDGENVI